MGIAREWAKEEREKLIAAATGKALSAEQDSSSQSFVTLSSNDPVHLESQTSADELALDNGTYIRPTHRTSVGAWTNPSPKRKPIRANQGTGSGYGDLRSIMR